MNIKTYISLMNTKPRINIRSEANSCHHRTGNREKMQEKMSTNRISHGFCQNNEGFESNWWALGMGRNFAPSLMDCGSERWPISATWTHFHVYMR